MKSSTSSALGKKSNQLLASSSKTSDNLHAVWAHTGLPAQISPVFDALLSTLKTRFRVTAAMIFMVRNGSTVINMRCGTDPAALDCKVALASCTGQSNQFFVIEDVAVPDSDVSKLPCVRFYAGAPLVIHPTGPVTGMLCLIHTKPRGFSAADRLLLQSLASVISTVLLMPHDPATAEVIALSAVKGILLLGAAQMVEAVNPRFTELTGFEVGDLLKTGVDDLLCLDRPSSGALLISHALLAETPAHGMTRCHTKAGGTLPVEVFVVPLSDQRGRTVKTLMLMAPLFSGPLEDFLLSLRSTERNELLSLHIAGLWSVNNTGLIVKLSGAPVAHLDALSQESLVGQRLDMADVFDATQTDWSAFYKSIAEHQLPDEVECCVKRGDYSQWYAMVGFKQYDARGRGMGYHGSFRNITERKLKEQALLKATERQHLILKGTNDGAWDWDLETGDWYLSPRWWDMMGRDPDDHPLTTPIWLQFIHPDDRQAVLLTFKNAVKQGRDSYESEFRMQHQRGHYFPVLGRGHIMRNSEGKAVRTSGTNQDLTGQRQSKAQIRLLQSAIETLRDVVLITHASPRHSPGPIIAYVNPAFESFTGYSRDEVIGKTPRLLQGPQTCRQTLNEIGVAMNNWLSFRGELVNYKKNGELFWAELDIVPVKAEGGTVFTHWVGVQRDITERKQAEQALRTTTERLAMALDATNLGLWVNYLDSGEAFRDEGWHKMLGYPPGKGLEKDAEWLELIHPDDMPRILSSINAVPEKNDDTFENEYRMRHADGRWVWIQSRGKVLERDAAGKPLVLAGTHLDVTAKVEARLLSERLNLQLSRCLEHVSVGIMVQREGIIKFANSAWLSMFGITHVEDVLGTEISAFVLPSDLEVLSWRRDQLMAGAALPSIWFNGIHRDGRVFKVLTNSTPIEWEGERHIMSTSTLPSDGALLTEEVEKSRARYEDLLANQVEKEQVHIAHELHDSLGSQLAGISLQAASLKLIGGSGRPLDEAVDQLLANIKVASEITRGLARGLSPVDDWPGAFGHAMKKLCHDFSVTNGLQCQFEMEGEFDSVVGQKANHLYRITQEAICNALRHGAARRINVSLLRSGCEMALTIFDDGKGFEVRSVLNEPRRGLGLSSMYARAHAIGAEITLEKINPKGFCVSVNWTHR